MAYRAPRYYIDGRWQDVTPEMLYTPGALGAPAPGRAAPAGAGGITGGMIALPQRPAPSAGVGRAPALPPWQAPGAIDPGEARGAIGDLRTRTSIPRPGPVTLPGMPAYPGLGAAPDRGPLDALLGRAGAGMRIGAPRRAGLGGPAAPNAWERLASEQFGGGFDPGRGQFSGRDLAERIFSEGQIGTLVGQRVDPLVRAYQDAERQLAEQASLGGYSDPKRLAALRSRAMIDTAGAMGAATREAQLDAAQLNAEQAARAAANQRANFESDLAARLGLGKLGLEGATTAGEFGLRERGLGQERDISRYQGQIGQRAQDVQRLLGEAGISADLLGAALRGTLEGRGQDIGWGTEAGRQALAGRGQDIEYAGLGGRLGVEQRAQDLEAAGRTAQLDTQRDLARAAQAGDLYGTQVQEQLGLGRLGADVRGQDIQAGLAARGQDIDQLLGLGRLGQGAYETEAGLWSGGEERGLRAYEGEQERGLRAQEGRAQRDLARQESARLEQLQREQTLRHLAENYLDPQQFEALLRRTLAQQGLTGGLAGYGGGGYSGPQWEW